MSLPQDTVIADKLANKAWEIREHSWSKYYKFRVGAALYLPEAKQIVCGVNIENASYGATICAERSALCSAISQFGVQAISALAVASDAEDPAVPCAQCLQFMAEFCLPTMPIYLVNSGGITKTYLFSDLLPHPFTAF